MVDRRSLKKPNEVRDLENKIASREAEIDRKRALDKTATKNLIGVRTCLFEMSQSMKKSVKEERELEKKKSLKAAQKKFEDLATRVDNVMMMLDPMYKR